MTTIDTHAEPAVTSTAAPSGVGRFLNALADIFTTTDSKKIGGMMMDVGLLALLGITGIGALLAFERVDTDSIALDAGSLGQMFSLFRVGLIFLVMLPLAMGAAAAITPLQIGSKALAFPRAAALGFWTWLIGSGLVVAAYLDNGGPGGGDESSVDLFLAGLGLLVVGLLVVAATVATTVLTSRAPGMRLEMVPTFAWSALVGAAALLLTLPVLLANVVYMFVDHRFGARLPVEENGWGGNAGIDHFMRFSLTQPQTYVYAIVALGLFAEVVPVFTKRRMLLRSVVLAGVAIFATASLSGVSMTEHGISQWSGQDWGPRLRDLIPYLLFNGLPLLGLLIVLGGGLRLVGMSLRSRSISFGAPLLFGLGAILMMGAGAAAHMLSPIQDLDLAGTVYEEAEFTFVAYGLVIGAMGAVVYWAPKWAGRTMSGAASVLLALSATLATVLVSVPYLIAGFNNQVGIWGAQDVSELVTDIDNDAAPELMNTIVAVGHALMALTVLAFLAVALVSLAKGRRVGDDPWDGHTLEWATSSPAPRDNFVDLPVVHSPEPLLDLKRSRSEA